MVCAFAKGPASIVMTQWRSSLVRTTESIEPRAQQVFDGPRNVELSRMARRIPIAEELRRYGVALVLASHPDNALASEKTRGFGTRMRNTSGNCGSSGSNTRTSAFRPWTGRRTRRARTCWAWR